MNTLIDAIVFTAIILLAGVGIQILHAMIEYPAAALIIIVGAVLGVAFLTFR